jgi:uncharacterized protein YjbJ (UPF0337 family)
MAINKDIVEGNIDQAIGKGEAFAGNTFNDTQTEVDGKVRELKGKAQEVYGKARDVYGKASETVKDWAEHAPDTVREAREKAARAAEEASSKVRHQVQEQPLATLLGGVALGFVVGWLINSRK